MRPTQEIVARAQQELAVKTLQQIQQDTALLWAARFFAARATGLPIEAEDFRQEAIEHGALAGDLDLFSFLLEF